MSQLFASDGQSTGASASAPVLPMNIQGCLIHVSTMFQIVFPFRLFQNMKQSSLFYTIRPCWLSECRPSTFFAPEIPPLHIFLDYILALM